MDAAYTKRPGITGIGGNMSKKRPTRLEIERTKNIVDSIEFMSFHRECVMIRCEHCNTELGIVYPFYAKNLTGCVSVALNAKCSKCG